MEKNHGFTLIRTLTGVKNTFRLNHRGFTLIELLIVMAIIAVLATVMALNFQQQMKKARDGKRKANIEQIRGALEMCKTDTGSYPLSINFGTDTNLTCGSNTYLNPLPDDPKAPSGHYTYAGCVAAPCTTYTLTATLETGGSYTGTPLGSQ